LNLWNFKFKQFSHKTNIAYSKARRNAREKTKPTNIK
jgi:hypothetical protein